MKKFHKRVSVLATANASLKAGTLQLSVRPISVCKMSAVILHCTDWLSRPFLG